MTLLQLEYFVALAENLHYTKTAEQLHISQPSLSYAINEIEKDLGVKLFHKDKQGITLNAYGVQFYPYAKKALEALENGKAMVTAMASHKETVVRWGYFHSVSASLIPALIQGFSEQNKKANIRFELTEDSVQRLFEQLRSGELDICFTCHQESWAASLPIARQALYLAVPADHPLVEREAVSFEDFAEERQILLTQGSDLRIQVDQLFRDNGAMPQVAFETRECNAALQYVALKFGVSILPQVPVMDRDDVSVLPILTRDGQELTRPIYLSYHKNRTLSPAVQFVIEFIRQQLSPDE